MTKRTFKQLLTSLTDFFSRNGKDVPIDIWDSRYDEPQPEDTFWRRKAMFISRLPGQYMLDLELDNFFRFHAGKFCSENKHAGYSKEEAWKDCVRNNQTRFNFYKAARQVRADDRAQSRRSKLKSQDQDQDQGSEFLKPSLDHKFDLWKSGHTYYEHAKEMREKYKPYFNQGDSESPSEVIMDNFETKLGTKTQVHVKSEELSDTDSEYELEFEKTNLNSLSDKIRILSCSGT